MAVLTNKSIASTYKSVLSIGATTESALTTSIQQLTDGLGNSSPLSMSTTQIQFNNDANTFSFPATRGTSGQILKLADANGTLAWDNDDLSNTLNFSGGTGTGSVTLDSQTLAFTGTANEIVTSASSQAITLSFPTTGVTLPNGSIATTQASTDSSTLVATTAYVKSVVTAEDLDTIGDSGTGSIDLDSQSLSVLGTVNEITTVAANQSITLSFPTAGVTLPDGSVATTQTASNNSTKVATTAYVDNQASTAGTVTSVALSVPTGLTVTGSPITTSGTITIGGTLGVANGGTGATTLTGILVGNGTSAISVVTDGTTSGQVLSTDGNGTYSFIDAGTGDVTVDGASVGNRVAVWNNTTGELRGTSAIATENSNIYLVQPSTNGTDKFNYIIGGAFAINENDFGIQNTGFGEGVFNSADFTGNSNTAFGLRSQYTITTGASNTSIGFQSMYDNRSGSYNVGLGVKTMFNQRISNYNVAIGYDSMDGVTASQTAVSDYNTAVGYQSLQSIQGGDNNTVIGKDSGNAITTGSNNVIIGSNTGSTIATSDNNIIISDGGGNNRIQVDSGGNVGIGTSTIESYWSGYTALKVGYNNSIFGNTADSVGSAFFISQNLYNDGGNYRYVGSGSDEGGLIDLRGGAFVFSNAPLGTAGNVASIVPRLTISSGGNATFNSQTIDVKAVSAGNTSLRLTANGGTAGTDSLDIINDGSNAYLYNRANTPLILGTNNTARLTISSGGESTFGSTTDYKIGLKDSANTEQWWLKAYTSGNFALHKNGDSDILTLTSGGDATFSNTTSANVVIARDNMFVGTGQLYIGAENSSTNNSFRQEVSLANGTFKLQSRENTTWTDAMGFDNALKATIYGAFNLPNITTGTGFDLVTNASGVFYVASSRKFKKNIEPIDIGLDFILSLQPVKYNLKSDDLAQVGFIAEDMPDERLQVIQPIDKDDLSQGVSAQGINYKQITAPLVKAIQEQQTIIEDLKARIETLEG